MSEPWSAECRAEGRLVGWRREQACVVAHLCLQTLEMRQSRFKGLDSVAHLLDMSFDVLVSFAVVSITSSGLVCDARWVYVGARDGGEHEPGKCCSMPRIRARALHLGKGLDLSHYDWRLVSVGGALRQKFG